MRTVNGLQHTGPCRQPSTGPCLRSLPNAWVPLAGGGGGGGGQPAVHDRIPSTNPGVEPPRNARDSGSARSHSTHLETSSSDRP